jgi:6-phosphofructokinase 1
VREQDQPYRWSVGTAPLSEVANKEKAIPSDFITEDGYHITEQARAYLTPLIEGEAFPPFNTDGLPDYLNLSHSLTARKLDEFLDI